MITSIYNVVYLYVILVFVLVGISPSRLYAAEADITAATNALNFTESSITSLDISWSLLINAPEVVSGESDFRGLRMQYRYIRSGMKHYIHTKDLYPDGSTRFDEEEVWNGSVGDSLVRTPNQTLFSIWHKEPQYFPGVRVPVCPIINTDTISGILEAGNAKFLGVEAIDGVACKQYEALLPKSKVTTVTVWLDPEKDYSCWKFRCNEPEHYESITTVTEMKCIDNVWVPMRWVNEHCNKKTGKKQITILTVNDVRINQDVDDSIFTLPIPDGAEVVDSLLPQ